MVRVGIRNSSDIRVVRELVLAHRRVCGQQDTSRGTEGHKGMLREAGMELYLVYGGDDGRVGEQPSQGFDAEIGHSNSLDLS